MWQKSLLLRSVTASSFCPCRCYIRVDPPTIAEEHRKRLNRIADGTLDAYAPEAEYPEIVPPPYADPAEIERHENKVLSNELRFIPTVLKKIERVNPYEREYSWPEERWHRPWHKPLLPPRKAWPLARVPRLYNSKPFYKYATKTAEVEGWPTEKEINLDLAPDIETLFKDRLNMELDHERHRKSQLAAAGKVNSLSECVKAEVAFCNRMLEHLTDAIVMICEPHNPYLEVGQIGIGSRVEAFWCRGGYRRHYPTDTKTKSADDYQYKRLVGDTFKKRGELAYCYRSTLASQIRYNLPLVPVCGKLKFC